MRFATATVHYADWFSLDRNLHSTRPYFDLRIIVDGAFQGFNYTDIPTPMICQFYSNCEVVNVFGLTEAQQRNIYLQVAEENGIDFILILDSDEYITVQDWEAFKTNAEQLLDVRHNVYGIKMRNGYNDQYSDKPRLWYRPWEMIYEGCHYCFHRKDKRPIQTMRNTIEGITIEHDHTLRTEEYNENWKKFREYQVRTEGS